MATWTNLPQTFDFKDQPKLDSEITKGRFKNKVAIVTGGCGGLGSGFVARFVNDGAAVAIIDLNEARALELITEIGGNIKFYKTDVTKREACFTTVTKIAKDFGKINHLVNAVAYFGSKVSILCHEFMSLAKCSATLRVFMKISKKNHKKNFTNFWLSA
jgi:NAD(P)-dependent dehydrogenase (short-subunit alcohol dehydrogenase family)